MTTTAFDVISPVDETIVETVRFAGRDEMDARVDRADRAFATWRRVAPGDRARLLRRFADAVDADIETLAGLEVRNAATRSGTPGGRPATYVTCSATTPRRLSG
jgi:acyl-CoA reductase-like NAD-dependent aldehyde dehydrogenase